EVVSSNLIGSTMHRKAMHATPRLEERRRTALLRPRLRQAQLCYAIVTALRPVGGWPIASDKHMLVPRYSNDLQK
ncbi:MAG: hypothetical protein ABSE59_10105, partial [Opitutaceae bacterium]